MGAIGSIAAAAKPSHAARLDSSPVPSQVQELYEREREVATIVYRAGSGTALSVQAELSDWISNGAIRSMLGRLVRKGILKRTRRGRHGAYVYLPAITTADVRERAIRQLAEDHFNGSLLRATAAMAGMLEKEAARLR